MKFLTHNINMAGQLVKSIGLTGGIASGKSLVAGILEKLGAVIIDADQLARDVVIPGPPPYEAIKKNSVIRY